MTAHNPSIEFVADVRACAVTDRAYNYLEALRATPHFLIKMAFKYSEAVPWGRSYDEYRRMFALSTGDLNLRIIGCGDGPAVFNAAMFQRGCRVVSCDPLYELDTSQIQERIDATYDNIMRQTRENQDRFVWADIQSPDELGARRLSAMRTFMADFVGGKQAGRYVTGELPNLPFEGQSFDLAICSHFLFLYSDNLTLEFHQSAIEEMCRVAHEARIFPILNYNADVSPYIEPLLQKLPQAGYNSSIEEVPYEFQRGGNKMLRVWKTTPK